MWIHHFSDASELSYGSVTYIRLVSEKGQIHYAFLMAKSRLAQLKKITSPRLELAAAATSELNLPIDEIGFWTGNQTVLCYLVQETERFHTYVANRMAYIRNDTSARKWSYVR